MARIKGATPKKNRKTFTSSIDTSILESFNNLAKRLNDELGVTKARLIEMSFKLLLEKYNEPLITEKKN